MQINDSLEIQSSLLQRITTINTTATLTIENSLVKVANGATAVTLTMPTAIGNNGALIYTGRSQLSTGTITINAQSGQQIEALNGTLGTSTSLAAIGSFGGRVIFISNGANWLRKING